MIRRDLERVRVTDPAKGLTRERQRDRVAAVGGAACTGGYGTSREARAA